MKRSLQVGLMWAVLVGFLTLGTVEMITGWPKTKSDRRDEIVTLAAATGAFVIAGVFTYFKREKDR